MKEENLGVALIHEICIVCGKETNEQIIMNQILSPKNAKDVKSMHKKAIGYAQEPCEECKELMTKGYILIEYDEALTEDKSNPYRTGNIWVIAFAAAKRMNMDKDTFENGYALIDKDITNKLGLHKTEQ